MPVSVITPAFQAERSIERTVGSLLAQTAPDWEMIIAADDGQDYKSLLKAKGIDDARLRFAATKAPASGPGAARNAGLDKARHPVTAYLDADDAYAPDYLSVMAPLAQHHGACNSALRILNEDTGERMPLADMPLGDRMLSMPSLMRCGIGYANIVVDRSRCPARWPEGLHYGEDLLFWMLLLDDLGGIHYTVATHYDYYYRVGSLSRPDEKDTRGLCERRAHILKRLEENNPPIRNRANARFLMRFLKLCNDTEAQFNYTLMEPEIYNREMKPRFDALFAGA